MSIDYGLDLTGWELTTVWDISDDGSTLVGPATNPQGQTEGYIVHLGDVVALPGITVTPNADLETSEDDITPSASFTVVLDTQPAAPVSVAVSSSNPGEGIIAGATGGVLTLSFDAANWNVPQTVNVQGVDDSVPDGDQAYSIQVDPSSTGDTDYDRLRPVVVSATNLDNDAPPASANDIYVGGIDLQTRMRGGKTDGRIVIDVRNDCNTNGADSLDTGVQNVLVTVTLTGPSGTQEYSGYTDASGVFRSGWIGRLAPGNYTVEVINLAHPTYDWNMLLDLADDADGDGLPDDVFALL